MYERQPTYAEQTGYEAQRPMDLFPLSRMPDWQVVPGEPDIRGWNIIDRNANNLGVINDLLVNADMGQAFFAIVTLIQNRGSVLIPIDLMNLDRNRNQAVFLGTLENLWNAPQWTGDINTLGAFYDYWGRLKGAAAPQAAQTAQAQTSAAGTRVRIVREGQGQPQQPGQVQEIIIEEPEERR